MSDLQCPARFVLVAPGGPGVEGADVVLAADDPVLELEHLADLNRGVTLVVEVPQSALAGLPPLLRPPAAGAVTAEVDSGGWRRVTGEG